MLAEVFVQRGTLTLTFYDAGTDEMHDFEDHDISNRSIHTTRPLYKLRLKVASSFGRMVASHTGIWFRLFVRNRLIIEIIAMVNL